jgi:hypothetical protein
MVETSALSLCVASALMGGAPLFAKAKERIFMTNQNPGTGITETDQKIQADSQHGIIGSWWQLGIGMSEASCTFGFGLAQDVRTELRRRADVTLTFAEEMGIGGFKFVRKVIDRADRIASEALGRGESGVLVVTRTLRRTGHGVTDLASTALSDTIGSSAGPRRTDGQRQATA